MPCAAIAFPPIALGLFKARFRQERIPCEIEHLNILFAEMVGWDNYNALTQMSGIFAGEQMFAGVLFGNNVPSDSTYHGEIFTEVAPDLPPRYYQMKSQVEPFLNCCLERIPWDTYDIIGFTCLFEQNTPSLSLAYLIKRYFPDKTIVFGGSNCEDVMGLTLHEQFPCIDYLCTGEADHTFPELVRRISSGDSIEDLPGVVYRDKDRSNYTGDASRVESMDSLPMPDYDDYFKRLSGSYLSRHFMPYLLFETSRGCWWGEKAKCAFCGLNGKNIMFRSKSADQVIEELTYLARRYHQVEYIQVVDNVLDHSYFDEVLPSIAKMNLKQKLYFEIRPTLDKWQIKILADAGAVMLQAGIENLSPNILKLMRKGTTSLHNIRLLKWCKQYGVDVGWNIIYGFPGEVPEDYRRLLELAQLIIHLHPPSSVGSFRLDRFSYNLENAEKLGLINVRPQEIYRYIYPFDDEVLADLVYHFDFDYREEIDDGNYLPLIERTVMEWKSSQYQCYTQRLGDRLIVIDDRPVAQSSKVVIEGIERLIYEYCDEMRSLKQVVSWIKETHSEDVSENRVRTILDGFVDSRLMIKERRLYLSLAIMRHLRYRRGSTRRNRMR
jgi:ribosomal peptide maturation radical SAM protein 1